MACFGRSSSLFLGSITVVFLVSRPTIDLQNVGLIRQVRFSIVDETNGQ